MSQMTISTGSGSHGSVARLGTFRWIPAQHVHSPNYSVVNHSCPVDDDVLPPVQAVHEEDVHPEATTPDIMLLRVPVPLPAHGAVRVAPLPYVPESQSAVLYFDTPVYRLQHTRHAAAGWPLAPSQLRLCCTRHCWLLPSDGNGRRHERSRVCVLARGFTNLLWVCLFVAVALVHTHSRRHAVL